MVMQLSAEEDRRLLSIEDKLDKLLGKVNDLVTQQGVMDQRVSNLEKAPERAQAGWTLGFSGCNVVIMAASALVSLGGFLTGLVGLVVALLVR